MIQNNCLIHLETILMIIHLKEKLCVDNEGGINELFSKDLRFHFSYL